MIGGYIFSPLRGLIQDMAVKKQCCWVIIACVFCRLMSQLAGVKVDSNVGMYIFTLSYIV